MPVVVRRGRRAGLRDPVQRPVFDPVVPRTPLAVDPGAAALALCVVAKDGTELSSWLAAHDLSFVDELVAIDNRGGRFGGYGSVAKRALHATVSSVFGLCHADTLFRGDALRIFRDTAFAGAVTGIVGRTMDSAYHWSKNGGVDSPSCLDGCAIFFRRDSGLDFDVETFDGFHCVGEDIALAARSRGIPLVIPRADAEHMSTSNFPPGADHSQGNDTWLHGSAGYYKYVAILREKYKHLKFHVS